MPHSFINISQASVCQKYTVYLPKDLLSSLRQSQQFIGWIGQTRTSATSCSIPGTRNKLIFVDATAVTAMFSFLLTQTRLQNFLAPRPDHSKEFQLLLNSGQYSLALERIKKTNHSIPLHEIDQDSGLAPIHYASASGSIELLVELLTQSCEVDLPSVDGSYPLHLAAINNKKLIIEVLLRSGADSSIPNADGLLPVELTTDTNIKEILLKSRKPSQHIFSPLGIVRQQMIVYSAEKERLENCSFKAIVVNVDANADVDANTDTANRCHKLDFSDEKSLKLRTESNESNAVKPLMSPSKGTRKTSVASCVALDSVNGEGDDESELNSSLLQSKKILPPLSAASSEESDHEVDFRETITKGQSKIIPGLDFSTLSSIGEPPTDLGKTEILSSRQLSSRQLRPSSPISLLGSNYSSSSSDLKKSVLQAATETAEALHFTADEFENTRQVFRACNGKDFTEKNKTKLLHLLTMDSALSSCRITHADGPDGQSPLHIAARYGHIEAAKILICFGASTWITDIQGRTPLHISAEYNKEEMCTFLRDQMKSERKIDPVGPFAPTDLAGTTPLGWAALGSKGNVSPFLKSSLFKPGDSSVLPLTPHNERAGKSPWRAPGGGDRENILYAFSEAKCYKETMEDRLSVSVPVSGRPAWNFFCVLDGHGGSFAAQYLVSSLPKILSEEAAILARQLRSPFAPGGIVADMDTTPNILKDILLKTCKRAEEDLMALPRMKVNVNQFDKMECFDSSGSTALLCLISAQFISVGNIGDSRAILAKLPVNITCEQSKVTDPFILPSPRSPFKFNAIEGGEPDLITTVMSYDHKFTNETEKTRALKAGAILSEDFRRVSSQQFPKDSLAMSRSFGDYFLKQNKTVSFEEQAVIAIPDVITIERSNEDAFIIMACDGIWDVMTNRDVVNFVGKKLGYTAYGRPVGGVTTKNIAEACDSLLEECIRRNATDNLSILVIVTGSPGSKKGDQPIVAGGIDGNIKRHLVFND